MAQSIPVLFLLFISAFTGVVFFGLRNRAVHSRLGLFALSSPMIVIIAIAIVRLVTNAPGRGESPLIFVGLFLFAIALYLQLRDQLRKPENESEDSL